MTATTLPRASGRRRPLDRGRLLSFYYLVLFVALYLPLGVLFFFSVSRTASLEFPPQALTLDWYAKVFQSPQLLNAAKNSVVVGVVSAIAATTLGTMVALLAVRYRFRAKWLLVGLAAVPLIVPFIVLAVALFLVFRAVGVPLSLGTIAIGHTVVALPFTLLIIGSRLINFERHLDEAAMDLGATHLQTLRFVVLPIAFPAMVSAFITAFTVSFDEFALALFLAGPEQTFPVYLYSQLRFANQLPALIAMAVLLMVGTVALLLLARAALRRRA